MTNPAADWRAAYAAGFTVGTEAPTPLLRIYQVSIPIGPKAADLGSGHGRNSGYLAALNLEVEAYDLVAQPEAWAYRLPLVAFYEGTVLGVEFTPRAYGVILAIDLLQFMPADDVISVIQRASIGLAKDGILIITFSVKGGIHDVPQFAVPKYKHRPDFVKQVLRDCGLVIDWDRLRRAHQTNGPFTTRVLECQLVASKPEV